MRDTVFHLGSTPVGRAHPPLFLADIGTFFGQDMVQAHRMVDGLKEAGCTVVKGEILHRADICIDDDTMENYYDPVRGMISERNRDLIERKIVSFENYKILIAHCKSLDMELVMSVYDLEAVDFAIAQGVAGLKIASSNISHEPLIRYVAQKRVPMFVDTGKSTFVEIAQAVQWMRDEGHDAFVLQHSPAAPPAPVEEQRLRMLNVLGDAFNCEVGLSDHHAGNEMMMAAVALGACCIEKGLCRDDASIDQDVAHAMRSGEVKQLKKSCNDIYLAMREAGRWNTTPDQLPPYRMGLIAKRELRSGDPLSFENIDFAFPVKGISCADWSRVAGWQMANDVGKGKPINWEDTTPGGA
ncbi:MAG: hypothetical protein COB90_08135 [Hyphomicrobiales bacterium]|nr:MAG: hypothetical protein COB90_08135 [Hyphomicrobiales bacterium]